MGPKSLVKIGSVTAKIFLNRTNVSGTYVAWTCHPDSWHLLKMVPGTYLKSLVKVRYKTTEIFLIWTNVARTNVAWTNVTLTVGIC